MPGAPIYDRRWMERRKVQGGNVRIPDNSSWILSALREPLPFLIDIFDQTLGAFLTGEDGANVVQDFWWTGITASFSVGSATSTPFTFQLFDSVTDRDGNEAGHLHQQKPVNVQNFCGTAQKQFFLKVPRFFRRDTELICTVQNLQNASNAIQICLVGYLGVETGKE